MSSISTTPPSRLPWGLRPGLPSRWKIICWLTVVALGLIIFVFDLQTLNPHHPAFAYYIKVRYALIPHFLFGSIAMLSGPIQFSSRVRAAYPRFHRILGRWYVFSVLLGAPFGFLVTLIGPRDPFFTIGVGIHAAVWFVTTLMAFLTARNRHIPEHRQWMVRSYVLTFSFVASRIIHPIWNLMGMGGGHNYGIIDAGLNVAYLLITDICLNWRQITTRRG